jgi:hypothetical protein
MGEFFSVQPCCAMWWWNYSTPKIISSFDFSAMCVCVVNFLHQIFNFKSSAMCVVNFLHQIFNFKSSAMCVVNFLHQMFNFKFTLRCVWWILSTPFVNFHLHCFVYEFFLAAMYSQAVQQTMICNNRTCESSSLVLVVLWKWSQ